jgi:hypothetical protein
MFATWPARFAVPLLLAAVSLAPAAHAQASALSHLMKFDASFTLTDDQGVRWLRPRYNESHRGTGGLGANVRFDPNWPRGIQQGPFDPADPAKLYRIHAVNGPVTASVTPPDRSRYVQNFSRQFVFFNYDLLAPAVVSIDWTATYTLAAVGKVAHAELFVRAISGGVRTPLIDRTVDSPPDQTIPPTAVGGTIRVRIQPARISQRTGNVVPGRRLLTLRSHALALAYVPEPATVALLGTGLALLAVVAARGRRWGRASDRRRDAA